MTAITADMLSTTPPFSRAHEALSSIMALHGLGRMAAWSRAANDDATRIVAVILENTKLAVNLLRDLNEAQRSGNDRKLAKVRRRLDRVLAGIRQTKVRRSPSQPRYPQICSMKGSSLARNPNFTICSSSLRGNSFFVDYRSPKPFFLVQHKNRDD